ncbi:protein Spindly [Biomphalaria glabrata]|uniref:Protein Spindly-like n=2 Tax=Biomphalaria glabrata TaxID=6526 RepID=A0A9W2YQH1_BIOGL|nr:protein Spindly-like [Biomphalaria glabrata]XP_055864993.1 protein Spindly-like [Biomphalaria glabrata]XP_055864994.1 protein Spindly-like [Biomphalaria glabrata]XP_055864995.1 protein Spindly-like [Biomphalaria glabrata]XP_055864996.1 protein Spindly-like [Biomphalaria glabrata]KAI8737540.1 protein Spindly-like [Biomphalaria glabrata]
MESSLINDDNILLEELELKKQDLYKANQNIEILTRNLQHLEEENTELKTELDEYIKRAGKQNWKNDEIAKFDGINRQKITDLQHCLEEAQASERLAVEEKRNLEKKLKQFLETASSCAPAASGQDDEIIHELHSKLCLLEEEKMSLKEKLVEAALEHQQNINELNGLRQELKEKEEEIDCLENQFTSQCNINEHLRDENMELKSKLEADVLQVGTNKKGNSLFSEVDDRRVIAETKIVKLESFLKKLEEQLTKEQKENKRLKQQILLLRQTASTGYSEDSVKGFMAELAESKRKIIQLTETLQKKELVRHEPREFRLPSLDSTSDSDKLYIKYLQDIIQDNKKELDLKLQELQQKDLQLRRSELLIAEVKMEKTSLVHERDKLKSMNAHLNVSLQELQRKHEPELFNPPSLDKVKIIQEEPKMLSICNSMDNMGSNFQKTGILKDIDLCKGENKENVKDHEPGKSFPDVNKSSLSCAPINPSLPHTQPNVKFKTVTYQEVEAPSECKQQ